MVEIHLSDRVNGNKGLSNFWQNAHKRDARGGEIVSRRVEAFGKPEFGKGPCFYDGVAVQNNTKRGLKIHKREIGGCVFKGLVVLAVRRSKCVCVLRDG